MNALKDNETAANGKAPKGVQGGDHAGFFKQNSKKIDKTQLEFFLHCFSDDGNSSYSKPLLTRAEFANSFASADKDKKDFVIFWPICLEAALYEDRRAFLKLLTDIKAKYKGKSLHLILDDTGELYRHNLAKSGVSPNSSNHNLDHASPSKSQQASPQTSPESTSPPLRSNDFQSLMVSPINKKPATLESERNRQQGIDMGKALIDSLSLDELARELGIKISVLAWHQVKEPASYRALFKKIIGRETEEDPEYITQRWENNDIHQLATFVESEYNAEIEAEVTESPNFSTVMSSILTQRGEKDSEKFGKRYNIDRSLRYNKAYLWEEKAHVMLTLLSVGDLINVMIQPEIFPRRNPTPRTGGLVIGEVLHEYCIRLLSKRLGIDYTKEKGVFPYLTVGIKPEYLQNINGLVSDTEHQNGTNGANGAHITEGRLTLVPKQGKKAAHTTAPQNSPSIATTTLVELLHKDQQALSDEELRLQAFLLGDKLQQVQGAMKEADPATPPQHSNITKERVVTTKLQAEPARKGNNNAPNSFNKSY